MAKACSRCRKAFSFWQGLGIDLCADCQSIADRENAERERLAAEQATAALRDRETLRRKCPTCGGTRFHKGWLPDSGGSMFTGSNCVRFRPDENLISSYPLYALACLNCGHVRLFLHEGDQSGLTGEAWLSASAFINCT